MFRLLVLIILSGMTLAQTSPISGGTTSPASPTAGAANTPTPAAETASPAAPAASNTNPAIPAASAASPSRNNRKTKLMDPDVGHKPGQDSLLDLPPLPNDEQVSLIGGTVLKVDRIMDQLEVRVFGGRKMDLAYDVRTQVYRDVARVPVKEIRPGDRVYLDTLLADRRVFAKSIRIVSKLSPGSGRGQVIAYDAANGTLTLRDELFPDPVRLRLATDSVIRKNQKPGSAADLEPGTLVSVRFTPGGNREVQEISVLAIPGTLFIFSGPITYLDLSSHLLALANKTDGKSYDINFDPSRVGVSRNLREGTDVTVNATFNGEKYVADSVKVNPSSNQ